MTRKTNTNEHPDTLPADLREEVEESTVVVLAEYRQQPAHVRAYDDVA